MTTMVKQRASSFIIFSRRLIPVLVLVSDQSPS